MQKQLKLTKYLDGVDELVNVRKTTELPEEVEKMEFQLIPNRRKAITWKKSSKNSKNLLSGWIKSVSESVNFFSPQTPVIFAGDFGTREMLLLLTATRPQGERIDFISKNCSSEMPIFLVTERIFRRAGYSNSRAYSCLVNNIVSKDIVRFFLKKQTNKRTNL